MKRKIGFAPLRAALAWIPRNTVGGYGPEHFVARIGPRPFVPVCATGDARIPRYAVETLYNAAREPRELLWVEGAPLDGGRPKPLEPILAAMFERLDR